MTTVRRLVAGAVMVTLVAASAVLGTMAPVAAAAVGGSITSPSNGEKVSSRGAVQISAEIENVVQAGLYVGDQKIAEDGCALLCSKTISASFDPGDAANGKYTVTLKGTVTGKVYDTSTFVVSRPPAAPSGVAARMAGKGKAVVTWAKGAEPDLRSYEVSTADGGKVGSVAVGGACTGAECTATVAVPAAAASRRVGFTVRAFRSDGDGGSVASARSKAAYVTLPAPKSSSKAETKKKSDGGVQDLPRIPSDSKDRDSTSSSGSAEPVPAVTKASKGDGSGLVLPSLEPTEEPAVAAAKRQGVPTADPNLAPQSSGAPLRLTDYALLVAVGVILLIAGAHIGAWMRRRSEQPIAEAAGARAMARVPVVSAPATSATTTGARRPAVILAVAKARPAEERPEQAANAEGTTGSANAEKVKPAANAGDAESAREPVRERVREIPAEFTPPAASPRPVPGQLALPAAEPKVGTITRVALRDAVPLRQARGDWDDYLPPQPRSMEDSGYWERPQPGADGFWDPDTDPGKDPSSGKGAPKR